MWCMLLYIWLQKNSGNSRVLSLIVTTGIICLSLSSISKKTRWNYFLFIVQFILYVLSKVEKTHVKFLPKSNLTSMWLQRVSTMGVVQNWVEFSPDVEVLVTTKSNWRWFLTNEGKIYFNLPVFFKEAMHNFDFTASGMSPWPGAAAL